MTAKYKRRTFSEIEFDALARGHDLGREQARKEFEMAYQLLSKAHSDTMAELALARQQLANVSLSKLAWSRITGLFKGGRHDL